MITDDIQRTVSSSADKTDMNHFPGSYMHTYINLFIICLTSCMLFSTNKKNNKSRQERKEGRRKKNPAEEGCEGQDEVKTDSGGKLVKGIYTLLPSEAGGQAGIQTNERTANIDWEDASQIVSPSGL